MTKEYAVNTRYASSNDEYWRDSDMADWFETWEEAYEAAEQAFEDPEVEETVITIFEDGDAEDFPLYMIRENGSINQYRNGELLWL